MRISGLDALDEFALFGMTGNDGVGVAGALLHSRFAEIEAEAGFAHFGVRPVTTEAAGGEDRLHVLIEVEMGCGASVGRGVTASRQEYEK